jgi:hypothetical protein
MSLTTLNAIFTAAIVLTTICYTIINARIHREMQRTRKLSLQPMLSVNLIFSEKFPKSGLDIKAVSLSNIGNAPAINTFIESEFLIGEKSIKNNKMLLGQVGNEEREILLSKLLSEEIDIKLEMMKEILDGNQPNQLTFRVKMIYSNFYGVSFESLLIFNQEFLDHNWTEWKLISQDHHNFSTNAT